MSNICTTRQACARLLPRLDQRFLSGLCMQARRTLSFSSDPTRLAVSHRHTCAPHAPRVSQKAGVV